MLFICYSIHDLYKQVLETIVCTLGRIYDLLARKGWKTRIQVLPLGLINLQTFRCLQLQIDCFTVFSFWRRLGGLKTNQFRSSMRQISSLGDEICGLNPKVSSIKLLRGMNAWIQPEVMSHKIRYMKQQYVLQTEYPYLLSRDGWKIIFQVLTPGVTAVIYKPHFQVMISSREIVTSEPNLH